MRRVLSSRSIERRAFKRPPVNKTGAHRDTPAASAYAFIDRSREDSPLRKHRRISADSLRTEGEVEPGSRGGGLLSSPLEVKIYSLPFFLSTNRSRPSLTALSFAAPRRFALRPSRSPHGTTEMPPGEFRDEDANGNSLSAAAAVPPVLDSFTPCTAVTRARIDRARSRIPVKLART